MIIGIDIDDTITDTYEVMFNYAQDYTANFLKREPIIKELNSCNNHFYTKRLHDWNDEEEKKFFELYYQKIVRNTKPKTLSLEYLKKLKEENNKIVLITARWQPTDFELNVEEETMNWIKVHNVSFDKLIINAIDKEKIAKEENIDVFVDDSFKNCKAVSDVGIKTFIMDSRVNRDLNQENIKRVYSWPHLYMKIKELY